MTNYSSRKSDDQFLLKWVIIHSQEPCTLSALMGEWCVKVVHQPPLI